MTSTTTSITGPPARPEVISHLPHGAVVSDGLAMARRNLLRILRTPQLVFFSTIQPIMFVLLFNYVFGGAIDPTGRGSYIDYLLPGIMVQTVAFGATSTGLGLATDMRTGILDRFRSLPMARSAVLSGRTAADAVRNLFVVLLMVASARSSASASTTGSSRPSPPSHWRCCSGSPSRGSSPSSG